MVELYDKWHLSGTSLMLVLIIQSSAGLTLIFKTRASDTNTVAVIWSPVGEFFFSPIVWMWGLLLPQHYFLQGAASMKSPMACGTEFNPQLPYSSLITLCCLHFEKRFVPFSELCVSGTCRGKIL